VALVAGYKVNLKKLRKWVQPVMIVAIVLLVLVLFAGKDVLGARRTLVFGPISFQPSEFAKIALILYLADALARRKEKVQDLKSLAMVLVVFGITVFLIQKEDLGTAMAICGAVVGILFMAGANFWHLVSMATIGIFGGLIMAFHKPYRLQRLITYLDPKADTSGAGYQIVQSFIALGSGGLYGLGLGASRQKFFYLPEKFTDFIFAIIGEELGIIFGTLPVALMFLFLLYKGLRVAARTRDPFMSLLAGGITFQVVLQAFINMGVVTGLLPCTGIALPFISFGGSSLVFTLLGVGLLLNVAGEPKYGTRHGIERKPRNKPRPRFGDSCEIPQTAKALKKKEEEKCESSLPAVELGATYTPQ
ncbi:MAG: FtsW/RodA/SpoVE family cell cycle protein, partial [Vulcanimicrobiota bacterium]